MTTKISFNGHLYKNKTELTQFVRDKLNNYIQNGTTEFSEKNDEDYDFFIALLKRHSEYERFKKDIINIILSKQRNSITLCIKNGKGNIECISWIHCCKQNKPKSNEAYLYDAMRAAVKPYIQEHFSCMGDCEKCGSPFYVGEAHHVVQFKTLVENFKKENPNFPIKFIKNDAQGGATFRHKDRKYMNKWIDYHADNSEIIMLCFSCHQKETYEQRKREREEKIKK